MKTAALYKADFNKNLDEDGIIEQIRKGNSELFNSLVLKYQQRIYYTVLRIVLCQEEANDVVQETFIKAFKSIHSFKEGYKFYTWLYRIAVNTALNHIQQKKNKGQSLDSMKDEVNYDPKNVTNLEDEFYLSELQHEVRKGLESVPEDMRAVFVLRVYRELTYKEIAETLDISIGTVMSRLNRARIILKEKIQKLDLI